MKWSLWVILLMTGCRAPGEMGKVWYGSDGTIIKEKKFKRYKSPKPTSLDSVYIKRIDSILNTMK